MSCSISARSIPTCTAPRLAPLDRTKATGPRWLVTLVSSSSCSCAQLAVRSPRHRCASAGRTARHVDASVRSARWRRSHRVRGCRPRWWAMSPMRSPAMRERAMSCASATARVPSATASASTSASSRAAWPPASSPPASGALVVARVGGGDLRQPGDAPAQLGGGVHEDVRRHPARPPLHRVGPDAVVHRQHRGGGPLVVVAERPPPPGQAPRAGQEQLEQHPGGQVVAGSIARRTRASRTRSASGGAAARTWASRSPSVRAPTGVEHLAQLRPGRRVVGQVHRPLGLEQPEHVGHGPDHPDRWPPIRPRPAHEGPGRPGDVPPRSASTPATARVPITKGVIYNPQPRSSKAARRWECTLIVESGHESLGTSRAFPPPTRHLVHVRSVR